MGGPSFSSPVKGWLAGWLERVAKRQLQSAQVGPKECTPAGIKGRPLVPLPVERGLPVAGAQKGDQAKGGRGRGYKVELAGCILAACWPLAGCLLAAYQSCILAHQKSSTPAEKHTGSCMRTAARICRPNNGALAQHFSLGVYLFPPTLLLFYSLPLFLLASLAS